ncbi:MAG: hypothetical protein ACO331_07595 [Prochlorothrix sp.]
MPRSTPSPDPLKHLDRRTNFPPGSQARATPIGSLKPQANSPSNTSVKPTKRIFNPD